MFARKVSVRLKPNSLRKFVNLVECEILPWLRRQTGFQGLITLALPDNSEVTTISFWDQEGNVQAYDASGYPQVLQVLEELLDAIPYVKTFEVVSSTFKLLAHGCQPAHENVARERSTQFDYHSFETGV